MNKDYMMQELRNIFESNIKALEILYVLEGVKPVARVMVKEDEKDKILAFFKKNGINYSLSDFKVMKQDEDKEYSDKAIKIDAASGEKGHFFVYASKDEEKAEKAKELEKDNKHTELGILLGYPRCCSEFFENNFEEESKKQNDFTLRTLKNSDGFQFPFYLNIAARHFDLALLSHFPCSFNCKDSIQIAKRYLETVGKHDKQAAEIIEGMLKGAVIYTETNGVFLLRYSKLENNRLYYKGIMGSKNNQLYERLNNAEHVDILSKDRIRLKDLEMKNTGIMLFS